MNYPFTVYEIATGRIIKSGFSPDENISMQAGDGEKAIPFACNTFTDYVVNDEIVPLPEKPSDDYVFDYIKKEWKIDIQKATDAAIQKRNNLLLASDWTQLPDAPADKTAWSIYRQHLRDIPQQTDFPIKIDWGTPPSEE